MHTASFDTQYVFRMKLYLQRNSEAVHSNHDQRHTTYNHALQSTTSKQSMLLKEECNRVCKCFFQALIVASIKKKSQIFFNWKKEISRITKILSLISPSIVFRFFSFFFIFSGKKQALQCVH